MMVRVEIALDRDRYEEALELLIPLRRQPTTEVQFAHVRAYRGLGDLQSALFWLNSSLKAPAAVPADWYLLRSRLILEIDPENVDEALAGLEEGLVTRGFDVALSLTCLDLEVASSRYDEALDRLATLQAVYQRDEELLSRRGDVLIRAGRHLEAEAAYTEALSALESLPPSRRSSPATQELENHLRSVLEEDGTN
jgi:tetratricopeptide (TPR) repeat protein